MIRINGRTIYAIYKDSLERSIVLWGDEPAAKAVAELLSTAGIPLKGTVAEEGSDIQDVAVPGEDMVVLLQDDYFAAADYLDVRGYKAGDDYRWIKRYGQDNLRSQYMFDPVLGFNTLGTPGTPGFFILREKRPEDAVVVILGGSSTDPGTFHHISWPEHLQKMIDDAGMSAVLYNGAVTGYTASQEMVKLLRDVMALKPDLVLSLTGINNNHLVNKYPFLIDYNLKTAKYFESHDAPTVNMGHLLPFRGVEFDKFEFDKYEYWLNQLKTMRYYCELYGVEYWAFLQPNLMSKRIDRLLPEEREYLVNRSFMGRNGLTPEGYRTITLGFPEVVIKENANWLFDLTDIFDNEESTVYEDGIHVNERGNYLTALAVFEEIKGFMA